MTTPLGVKDLSVNSLVPLKQLSSTPRQATVALQVPARLSAELSQAGHSFPFIKVLGAAGTRRTRIQEWKHF